MTAPTHLDGPAAERPGAPDTRHVVLALATLEARRNLTAPWLWLGILVTLLAANSSLETDFAAGGYQGVIASFGGIVAGTFVLAVLAGGRDRGTTNDTPLSPESVLDPDHRAAARLLGLLPVIGVGVLCTAAMFGAARIEGGFWVGDTPGRTDTAQHGPFEVLQPVTLLLLAATAGVALGRATAHRTVVCLLGLLVVVVFGLFSWAWQAEPVVFATLIQTPPSEVPIRWPGDRVDLGVVPVDWLLSAPDAYEDRWSHVVIDQRVAAAHNTYLLGLATLAGGFAVRGRLARPLIAGGVVLAVAGIVAQVTI